jgi:hypothetical protein
LLETVEIDDDDASAHTDSSYSGTELVYELQDEGSYSDIGGPLHLMTIEEEEEEEDPPEPMTEDPPEPMTEDPPEPMTEDPPKPATELPPSETMAIELTKEGRRYHLHPCSGKPQVQFRTPRKQAAVMDRKERQYVEEKAEAVLMPKVWKAEVYARIAMYLVHGRADGLAQDKGGEAEEGIEMDLNAQDKSARRGEVLTTNLAGQGVVQDKDQANILAIVQGYIVQDGELWRRSPRRKVIWKEEELRKILGDFHIDLGIMGDIQQQGL